MESDGHVGRYWTCDDHSLDWHTRRYGTYDDHMSNWHMVRYTGHLMTIYHGNFGYERLIVLCHIGLVIQYYLMRHSCNLVPDSAVVFCLRKKYYMWQTVLGLFLKKPPCLVMIYVWNAYNGFIFTLDMNHLVSCFLCMLSWSLVPQLRQHNIQTHDGVLLARFTIPLLPSTRHATLLLGPSSFPSKYTVLIACICSILLILLYFILCDF